MKVKPPRGSFPGYWERGEKVIYFNPMAWNMVNIAKTLLKRITLSDLLSSGKVLWYPPNADDDG